MHCKYKRGFGLKLAMVNRVKGSLKSHTHVLNTYARFQPLMTSDYVNDK